MERRVTKIKDVFDPANLHYIPSEDNPADPVSRGMDPQTLESCDLWFNGPTFLQQDDLPTTPFDDHLTQVLTSHTSEDEDLFQKFSSWTMVIRIVAYCLRMKYKPQQNFLSSAELKEAKRRVIKFYQHLYLSSALESLEKISSVPRRHWLYNLSPFVDPNGII